MIHNTLPITPTQLQHDFTQLGVTAGDLVMLHASVKAVGPVLGGPPTILQALLDTLTPAGTLMMYVGWNDIPDFLEELSAEEAAHYRAHHPPFDPATSRAVRDHGLLAECLRGWPGASRSVNAEASMAAVGGMAEQITRDHPLNFGYGAGSPLDTLVRMRGHVVLLGSSLDAVTLLHYAENRARMTSKAQVRYSYPIRCGGEVVWLDVDDFDTGDPLDDYELEDITRAYIATGRAATGVVGQAVSYRLDAADFASFAIAWLESRFGG
jgi:aminoglycoside 3-N-acetyltransferase